MSRRSHDEKEIIFRPRRRWQPARFGILHSDKAASVNASRQMIPPLNWTGISFGSTLPAAMASAVKSLVGKMKRRLFPEPPSPAAVLVLLLIPLMLLELVGMAAEGGKRYGTFEGAILLMAASLGLVWNVILGAVMFLARKPAREFVNKARSSPTATFVLFATLLALLEEGVTTTLTNLAPMFGNARAFITASRNYFEVVVWHSVIVIAPMFLVWAWLLTRLRFSLLSVFLLFGVNGVLAELLIGGPALVMAPFWIFVYGLMIFLPAYCFPTKSERPAPHWYHYPIAIGACLLASAATAILVNLAAPHLPHFGPNPTPESKTGALACRVCYGCDR